jgi:hypothetical protein
MRWFGLLRATLTGVCLLSAGIARADGLLYQLPADGSWVLFEAQYTFKVDGMEKPGQGTGTLKMASVGKALEGSEPCRWIEFKMQLKDIGPEQILINDEAVARAVPIHGRWPAYLSGPFHAEKKLAEQVVESKLGALKCDGVTGWIQYQEADLHMKVTFETRLHETAPFGVVSSRMQFDLKRDAKLLQTVDATMKLIDFGKYATTVLPDYK